MCSTTTANRIWSDMEKRQGRWMVQLRQKGAHFIGLVNVMNLKSGGLGSLGGEQLEWMEKDV
jgi:hypothetical protein